MERMLDMWDNVDVEGCVVDTVERDDIVEGYMDCEEGKEW